MHHPMPCGSDYTPSRTIFRLWAPHARHVVVQLFSTGSNEEPDARFLGEHAMVEGGNGLFTLKLLGNLKNQYYQYLITDHEGHQVATADPWALACGINGRRSMVVDLSTTDPVGWAQDHRLAPAACAPSIWEVHVGDFSASPASGVPAAHRGKYTAFTLAGTTLNGDGIHPTCVNYLKQLGVTHVQLQPIFDYCTVDERRGDMYNWGYDPENYNVPEGSYSSNPWHGGVRIRECKEMIQALHKAGIRVVMDVVYNHTYRKNSWLQFAAPGEYYRYAPDGTWGNASGCGTETASERHPFREYMIHSVLYWAQEYHIDGFRFDLMAIHDTETMSIIRRKLDELPDGKNILIYGEPWSAEPTLMEKGFTPVTKAAIEGLSGIGIFCDDTRDALVGSTFDAHDPGYVTGAADEEMVEKIHAAVRGWSDRRLQGYTNSPAQILHYVSCHDNYTLWDKLTIFGEKDDFFSCAPERIQLCKLASGICMTARGLAFFQSGEEFGRSKDGNDNTFEGPAILNTLDWRRAVHMGELVEWYRGLLALRRHIAPASQLNTFSARKTRFLTVPEGCVGFQYSLSINSRWRRVAVFYQPHEEALTAALPRGKWQVLADGIRSDVWQERERFVSGRVALPGKSVVILGQR